MARVFITGSADGIGLLAARLLVAEGHQVVLHARNQSRCRDAIAAVPGAECAILRDFLAAAADNDIQERFIAECSRLSGVAFPDQGD